MADDGEEERKELDLTSSDVVTKYKAAAEIVNSKSRRGKTGCVGLHSRCVLQRDKLITKSSAIQTHAQMQSDVSGGGPLL